MWGLQGQQRVADISRYFLSIIFVLDIKWIRSIHIHRVALRNSRMNLSLPENLWAPHTSSSWARGFASNIFICHAYEGLKYVFYECSWGDGLTTSKKTNKQTQRRVNDDVIYDGISINNTAAGEAAGCGRCSPGILKFPSSLRCCFYPRGSTPGRGRWICAPRPLPGALVCCCSAPILCSLHPPSLLMPFVWSRRHLRCT